ncbi:MAG: hypothetical protein M0R80_31420 [Proteobacteria bacterium]|jgi:hypothetical protein|nr:hypothetical protein [Pseudomonadota bacterium]
MNLKEIRASLESAGLHTIVIQDSLWDTPLAEFGINLVMEGDLEDFIKSVKVLNENVVFINVSKLEEDDFIYELERYDELSGEDTTIDYRLSDVLHKIKDFETYIGQDCKFELSVFFKNQVLLFNQDEKWWTQFETLRGEAIGKIKDRENLRIGKLGEEISQKQQVLLDKLKTLITDISFVRLATRKNTTQLDMRTYAREAIPELRDLNEESFKQGLQQLRSEIKAQMIRNK